MPEISRFLGIVIQMYRDEHPPHFHAIYGEFSAQISIPSPCPALVMFHGGDNDLLLARITTQVNRTPYDCETPRLEGGGVESSFIFRLRNGHP